MSRVSCTRAGAESVTRSEKIWFRPRLVLVGLPIFNAKAVGGAARTLNLTRSPRRCRRVLDRSDQRVVAEGKRAGGEGDAGAGDLGVVTAPSRVAPRTAATASLATRTMDVADETDEPSAGLAD